MKLYTKDELEAMSIEKAQTYFKKLHEENRKIQQFILWSDTGRDVLFSKSIIKNSRQPKFFKADGYWSKRDVQLFFNFFWSKPGTSIVL